MATFTMKEYIARHKLNVGLLDSGATRVIAQKLRKDGYERIRVRYNGAIAWVWTNERNARIKTLKEKLDGIVS